MKHADASSPRRASPPRGGAWKQPAAAAGTSCHSRGRRRIHCPSLGWTIRSCTIRRPSHRTGISFYTGSPYPGWQNTRLFVGDLVGQALRRRDVTDRTVIAQAVVFDPTPGRIIRLARHAVRPFEWTDET